MWDLLFTGSAAWFSVPALAGTGLFLLKLVLMLAGGDHHGGLDAHSAALDHPTDGADHDAGMLSVQGVLAFLMGFGWAGLVVLSSTRAELVVAVAAALVVGTGAMYLMGRLMSALMKLQTSGNIHARTAVGSEGTVYVTVPEGGKGRGQVMVVIDQKQRTYDAVSRGGELARNAPIRVEAVDGENTLVVGPA